MNREQPAITFEGTHQVPPGSLVVFRNPTVGIPEDIEQRLDEITALIASKVGHHDFATVVLGPDAAIEVLDEGAMRTLGWMRVPR